MRCRTGDLPSHPYTRGVKVKAYRRIVIGTWALAVLIALVPDVHAGQGVRFEQREAGPRAVVRLKESATVRGSAILLGEIAQIETKDQSLYEQLVALPIGQAPLPGLSRSFDPELITIKLRQYKIDPASLRIESLKPVMISSAHQLISSDEFFQAAKRSVLADRGEEAERMIVRAETLPGDVMVPPGSVELKARPRLQSVGLGSVPVVVEAWVDGRLYRSVSLSLRLSLLREVVVADRPLPPRALLKAGDVRLERRDIAQLQHEPLRDLTSAIGQRTVRMLAMGEVVASDAVELPPLVRKGALVTLTIERPGLLITAKGVAQEQGTVGQLVRVKTAGSGRAVSGKVEGEARVRVAF